MKRSLEGGKDKTSSKHFRLTGSVPVLGGMKPSD